MYPYLNREIPVVCISNTAESFFAYVQREQQADKRSHLIQEMQGLGDRALLYPMKSKLVFMGAPVHHESLLHRVYGYSETTYLTPQAPSPFLSLDILREKALMAAIAQYAGAQQAIYLIPHATTEPFLKLVAALRHTYQLTVITPESPSAECLWLRDYLDSKCGFHSLIAPWLTAGDCRLPLGITCRDLSTAAATAYWFTTQSRTCVAKADRGNDALGQTVIRPEAFVSPADILQALQRNPFLQEDLILIEEFIDSPGQQFPSVELFVPPPQDGQPQITYLCNQFFSETGRFVGLLVDQTLKQANWYPTFEKTALTIATNIQSMGYVGHFDLDAIIDHQENVFLLEINARRTGGTHVHEVAHYLLGPDYLNEHVLLSNTSMDSGKITAYSDLIEALETILFPIQHQNRGVLITHTSALDQGVFGYVIVAASQVDAVALQRQMAINIQHYVPSAN